MPITLEDAVWKDVLEAIKIYDCSVEHQGMLEQVLECAKKVHRASREFQRVNEFPSLLASLRLIDELSKSSFPSFGGVRLEEYGPGKTGCDGSKAVREETLRLYSEIILRRAEVLLTGAGPASGISYLARERLIDKATDLLHDLLEASLPTGPAIQDVHLHLARCYLERSRLILPKENTVPSKKPFVLEQGLEQLGQCGDSDEKVLLLARMLIEADRCGEGSVNIKPGVMSDAQKAIKDFFSRWMAQSVEGKSKMLAPDLLESWQVADYARESGLLEENVSLELALGLVTLDLESLRPASPQRFILAYKAALSIDEPAEAGKAIEGLVKEMRRVHFADPSWDQVVDILERMGHGRRSDLAVKCWLACEKVEERVKHPVYLRWYWSRLEDLYRMAFEDARKRGNLRLAVRIADSLKSRPALKMRILERVLPGNATTAITAFEMNYHQRTFDPDLHQEKTRAAAKKAAGEKPFGVLERNPRLPAGWATVHFFVGKDEGWCIVNYTDGDMLPVQFRVRPIWEAFQAWSHAYRNVPEPSDRRHRSTGVLSAKLDRLCLALGKELPALFDLKAENLLFIPHGFLHMVPLHAAKLDKGYLFTRKRCAYLPAGSFAGSLGAHSGEGESWLFRNWEGSEYDSLLDSGWDKDMNKVTPDELLEWLGRTPEGKPPRVVAIICHGEGDEENPCFSSLLLHNKRSLSYLELTACLNSEAIKGAAVILGACETDLSATHAGPVDEHLSLATPFLQKGASYVTANLWRVWSDMQCELVMALHKNSKSPHEALAGLQSDWLGAGRDIYSIAPFRILGIGASPETISGEEV